MTNKDKRNKLIPFNKPFIVGKELNNIAQTVLVESHLSGNGPFTKKCQKWIEEQIGCKRAFLTHSCTGALEMAAILCGIEAGDEVIMPSYTFVSTANAFVLRGGVPVFVDIREDTLNIDERLIEKAITDRTKAIVPVHYAGIACAMDKIMMIAERHNLLVIEDAAQAFKSSYNGVCLGAIGHMGCISFHETKNIISGEGGVLLLRDDRFVERAEIIWEKGTNRTKFFRKMVDKYTWVDIGSSFLPSEQIGAFLYAQLEQSEKIIATRCRIFNQYYYSLKPLAVEGLIRLPYIGNDGFGNGHIFYIVTGSFDERNKLIRYLSEKNIGSVFHYVPLHSSPAGKKYGRTSGGMTVTDKFSDRILRLPSFFELQESEVDRVVENIKAFYDKKR